MLVGWMEEVRRSRCSPAFGGPGTPQPCQKPRMLPPFLHQGSNHRGETNGKVGPASPQLCCETGSVSWDYVQHLKENIYRIYIHIPSTLLSRGSPVPPSCSLSIPPRPHPLPVPPQCPPLSGEQCLLSLEDGGIGNEKELSPPPTPFAPAPCCTLRQEKEEFLQECRGEGINIHVLGCVWLQLEGCLRGRRAGALRVHGSACPSWCWPRFPTRSQVPAARWEPSSHRGAWGEARGRPGGNLSLETFSFQSMFSSQSMGKKGKLVLAVKQTCPKSLPAPADLHPRARWQPVSGCCSFPLQRWPPASCSKLFPMCKQGGC